MNPPTSIRPSPQRPSRYPWDLRGLLLVRPSVGMLMDLCEENYRWLHRLAPGLPSLHGRHLYRRPGRMDLHLEVLEQTRYTTLIHLTYYFDHQQGQRPDPAAQVRAYHDSRQAEILELQQTALPVERAFFHPALEQKWRANLFLSKWLCYCVTQGHRFGAGEDR